MWISAWTTTSGYMFTSDNMAELHNNNNLQEGWEWKQTGAGMGGYGTKCLRQQRMDLRCAGTGGDGNKILFPWINKTFSDDSTHC